MTACSEKDDRRMGGGGGGLCNGGSGMWSCRIGSDTALVFP